MGICTSPWYPTLLFWYLHRRTWELGSSELSEGGIAGGWGWDRKVKGFGKDVTDG